MRNTLYLLSLILLFNYSENVIHSCSNGVFKCVSPTTLRICFRGQLISSEVSCPNFTYCSENSQNICVKQEELNDIIENEQKLINDASSKCVEAGIFPIPNTGCTKYLKCLLKPNGFYGKELTCYSGLFDPDSGGCSSNYRCPEDLSDSLEIPQCTLPGKFPIPNTNCKKYVICTKTANGFTSVLKNCYTGSFFNPSLGRCDKNYICDVNNSTPNTTTSIPITTTSTPITTTSTPITTTSTPITTTSTPITTTSTPITTTSTPITTTSTPITTTSTPSTTTSIPTTFTSTPITTTSISSTTTSGTTIPTNPPTDSSSISSTKFTESTTVISTTNSNIPMCNTTIFPTTTTTVEPTNPGSSTPGYVCPTAGKFPVENTSCKKFYLCTQTSQGLVYMIYECPNNSLFDPVLTACSIKYNCTEDDHNSSTTTNYTTIPTEKPQELCKEQGKFPIANSNCKKYVYCLLTTEGMKEQIHECPEETYFDDSLQKCTQTFVCLQITTIKTTTIMSTTPATSSNINTISTTGTPPLCTAQGKFPISNSNCKKYLMCLLTSSGLIGQEFECDEGLFFDPTTKSCRDTYVCTETEKLTSNFLCPTQGKFPVENSNCKRYILCTSTVSGYKVKEYECPNDSLFDSSTKECSNNYICDKCQIENEITDYECIEQGRFYLQNSNCQKYVLCVKTNTGIKGKIYKCPPGTNFNPDKKRCLKGYQCLEEMNNCKTTASIEPTTEIYPSDPSLPMCSSQGRISIPGSKCQSFLLCIKTRRGFVSAKYACPGFSLFNPTKGGCSENFICDENTNTTFTRCATIGRYPDMTSQDCKGYFICIEKDDAILGIRRECKEGYYFDPEIQRCSFNYICHTKNGIVARSLYQDVISPKFLVNGRCTTVGRYMVELTNCKNYVYCSANADGTLKATNFTCPTTTVFNQAIQKCTAAYTCPDSLCIYNPGIISWANPNVKDCTSYIDCEPVFNNIGILEGYRGVVKYCPTGMYFNPMLQACDPMYVCPT